MNCPSCNNPSNYSAKTVKACNAIAVFTCGKTFGKPKVKMLDHMILAEGKALAVLSYLVEGCSVRSSGKADGCSLRHDSGCAQRGWAEVINAYA